ncbi:hypothetical protein L1987_16563 [Smallanthus sonchifolius]|uniref:Uncharacterized protein n=1 Tax=Smallanthus sonchifolius TaxID=185202 RepID=A0ACB9IUS6_9ASTR|nr:hypothetical protein L1987_16563 [Smallanthus sonchifolius]
MPTTSVPGLNTGIHDTYSPKKVINTGNANTQYGIQNRDSGKSKGFDFSRAVNGSAGVSKPAQTAQVLPIHSGRHPPASRPAVHALEINGSGCSLSSQRSSAAVGVTGISTCADLNVAEQPPPKPKQQSKPQSPPVDTHNSFLVLDFEKSLKYNKLVGESFDSCMSGQGGSSGKDPDKSIAPPPQKQFDCQVNREYIEGVRILPRSIVSPPKGTQQPAGQSLSSETTAREVNETKDYGITDAQKLAITKRLCGPAQAVRAVDMDNWDQGEHDFFEDQVKAMGLDYDYCVEDVESDDENGTAQFFAAQMRVGMPKVGEDHMRLDPVRGTQDSNIQDNDSDEPMVDTGIVIKGEELNEVLLNKEYMGDSILDNLSSIDGSPDDLEANEEGEMEVCSGQNENSNLPVTAETMNSGSFTPTILANTNSEYQTGGVSEWERMNKDQVVIRWPERWTSNKEVDLSSEWDVTIHAVRNAWMEEFAEGMSDLHQRSRKFNDREAWRKETGKRRVLPNWLDIERATCNPDEALHCRRKKNEKVGKDSIVATGSKPKVSHASKLDKLYEELVAREVKLKEIAGNVLKTNANRVLLNSILSMKSCKIKKFSAQVDAQGMVTIDENMVDKEQDSEETFQTHTTTPKPSYAQRLTGISGTTLEGPIQYYPPLVNSAGMKVAVIDPKKEAGGYARVLVEVKVDVILAKDVRVWYPSVNGMGEKFVIIDVEFLNVPIKCDHCSVFGHSFDTCLERPRSSEERERDTITPSSKNTNVGVATAGIVDNEGDGFTLVRNRKSGSRQTNSGQWNNPRQFTNNSGQRRNVAGTQPVSRNRQNGSGNMNNYERNIVSSNSGVNVHADMGMDGEGGEQGGQRKESNHTKQRVVNKPGLTDVIQGLQGKGKSVRTSDIQMVETSNRFMLLDVDGNEMENNIEGMEGKDQKVHQPEERNAGWIKKQERTLNKDYSSLVNQDQRFEAKRYVLDKLIPLESVLSGWSKAQVQYFRHLCCIYEFGQGYLAVNRDKDNGIETNDIDIANEVENMEEVESETDATAMLMTYDGPILPLEYGPTVSTENSEEQEQPLVDMLRDGSTKPVC